MIFRKIHTNRYVKFASKFPVNTKIKSMTFSFYSNELRIFFTKNIVPIVIIFMTIFSPSISHAAQILPVDSGIKGFVKTRFKSDGSRVAIFKINELNIYNIENGVIQREASWSFKKVFPQYFPIDAAWLGDKLAISVVNSPMSEQLTSEEIISAVNSSGSTILIDTKTNDFNVIIPVAYKFISSPSDGQYLCCALKTNDPKNAKIDIYLKQGDSFTLTASFGANDNPKIYNKIAWLEQGNFFALEEGNGEPFITLNSIKNGSLDAIKLELDYYISTISKIDGGLYIFAKNFSEKPVLIILDKNGGVQKKYFISGGKKNEIIYISKCAHGVLFFTQKDDVLGTYIFNELDGSIYFVCNNTGFFSSVDFNDDYHTVFNIEGEDGERKMFSLILPKDISNLEKSEDFRATVTQ